MLQDPYQVFIGEGSSTEESELYKKLPLKNPFIHSLFLHLLALIFCLNTYILWLVPVYLLRHPLGKKLDISLVFLGYPLFSNSYKNSDVKSLWQ